MERFNFLYYVIECLFDTATKDTLTVAKLSQIRQGPPTARTVELQSRL